MFPRSAPAAQGISSRSIGALLDRFVERAVEGHSVMVVRHGHVVAEGWWAPYSADRPTLLYSVTKSFTSTAVGLVIADGLLALGDRVVDVLPDHVPDDVSEHARRLTVHDLLSMTTGHATDSLGEAWELEPDDLVKGFLRVPFTGTGFAYDNATTFVLARIVERVTGRDLREFLDERLLQPMGAGCADWDLVASGKAFGFHGLHLTTEAVAAYGELLLRGGRWGDRQLVPREWVEAATRPHSVIPPSVDDSARGYGYQFWVSEHGFYADGAFGQHCVVIPSLDLVVVVTSHSPEPGGTPDAVWECLSPGIGRPGSARDDEVLADRLRRLSFPLVAGRAGPGRTAKATVVAAADPPLPAGSAVVVEPVDGGWRLRLESIGTVEVGHGGWRESSPLGRPVVASGAWQGDTFVADLFVITTPHRVRLMVDGGTATATWSTVPLTTPDLALHLRAPLMTRPGVG
ncbi:beta-lactamase family protein [Couchioplanes caeruleus]|uniref:serine hydrolase domain-containing protein n=1 Tax=Couchioplanes caeruleus TaxID=56438 RepID=UPI0020C023F5|nr:serine hydrolase [Couchioplanes caeruleus]UQU63207.1 beta-lactamase family protein [Couchioplanes caeruleus]